MGFRITDDCIECLACLDVCPHQAISQEHVGGAPPRIAIEPAVCTHCWPFEQRPRCVAICPVDCIVIDADRPVPPIHLIHRELEQLLSVAGPFDVARMIARMRQWIREWFAKTVRSEPATVDFDQILDFYSCLSLMETEYMPANTRQNANTSPPAGKGTNA